MNRRAIQLVLVAALVAIAGCAGGMGGDPGSDSTTDDSSTMDSSDGGAGTAAFYVSDEPNVIDDFEHLNVTITKVGFKKTGDASDGDENETDDESETESDDGDESTNETVDETDDDADVDGNETDDGEAKDGEESDEEENDGEESDGESKDEEGDDDGDDERWVEYDVDNATVDLTELKGSNASMIDEFELPAGEYEKVFIYVSDTQGVLTDGTETKVKLPSNKLQLNSKFTIGDGERVDFVYDIAPHKAGKSGKYILKPVISESGTGDEVEIRDIDKEDEDEDEKDDEETEMGGSGNDSAEEKPQND